MIVLKLSYSQDLPSTTAPSALNTGPTNFDPIHTTVAYHHLFEDFSAR